MKMVLINKDDQVIEETNIGMVSQQEVAGQKVTAFEGKSKKEADVVYQLRTFRRIKK